MRFRPLSLEQRRIFVDGGHAYVAFREARQRRQDYRGGMHWKRVHGHEYLIRTTGGRGSQRSLGRRSPETERAHDAFVSGKAIAEADYKGARDNLQQQARLAKAIHLARVPKVLAGIARLIEQNRDLARRVVLIGTNALYAYEAAAGVQIESGHLATRDADLLWDTRNNLKIGGLDEHGLIGLLRAVDRTFEPIRKGGFRAINRDGYMVDLIRPTPSPPHRQEISRMSALPDDLVAVDVKGVEWVVSAPKMRQQVIDEQGYPAELTVPDPRVHALHKAWVAQQPDRDPVKKERDRAQALLVTELVREYMPDRPFRASELRMLPAALRPADDGLPPGFEDNADTESSPA